MSDLNKAMDEIAAMNEKGGKGTTKVKGGKTYTNVSTRVEVFRKYLGLEYGLDTQHIFTQNGGVMFKATVKKGDFIVAAGTAYSNSISKDKGIEKLESTAIGRCMAALGLSGGEYASENEMESWEERYDNPQNEPPPIHMDMGADDISAESWMNSQKEILTNELDRPKSTLETLLDKYETAKNDAIYKNLNTGEELELKEHYEQCVRDFPNAWMHKTSSFIERYAKGHIGNMNPSYDGLIKMKSDIEKNGLYSKAPATAIRVYQGTMEKYLEKLKEIK
jgi:hypothetical protein